MYGFKFLRSYSGNTTPSIETMKAAAETAIAKGDALIYSSGYLTPVTAGTGAVVDAVAVEAVSASAAGVYPDIRVIRVHPGQIYLASLDATPDQANVGVSYNIVGTTGIQQVDEGDTDPAIVRVLAIADDAFQDSDEAVIEVAFNGHGFQD